MSVPAPDAVGLRRDRIVSLGAAAASATFIIVTVCTPLPKPHGYAPYMFAYNIGFFFPMMVCATVSGVLSLIFMVRTIRTSDRWMARGTTATLTATLLLLMPMLLQLWGTVFLIATSILSIAFFRP